MARARNLKPGFFLNDELAECDPLARLLFAGLWCIADREGRLEDRPKRIKAEILPYDDCDVDKFLNDLQSHGFIKRYEVDGKRYIQIINFKKHQNPHIKENRKKVNKRSSLVKRIRADRRIKSVPMETVLSPEQCSVMRQFMTHLVFAKKLNPELNVGQFMKEYRKVM